MKRSVLGLAILVATSVFAASRDAQQPWMGMSVRPHRDASGQRLLHVERTVPGGPSERAGIRPGDLITKINGAPLRFSDDLDFLLFISERKPGERVAFHVVRQGTATTFVVKVGVMSESARAGWQRALQNARRARLDAQRAGQ